MDVHWQSLIANLAVVALFITTWVHGRFIFRGKPRLWRDAALGAILGLGAIASMILSASVADGVLFDLRMTLVAVAAFFGGPVGGVIAAAFAIAYRVVVGGAGAQLGAVAILTSAVAGFAVSWFGRGRLPSAASAWLLALVVGGVNAVVFALLTSTVSSDLLVVVLPSAVMNTLATLISTLFIMGHAAIERERDLLRAAFLQSPDMQYIKTVQGRFAAVNGVLAHSSGYSDPQDLVGKTDFDVMQRESAETIRADDRQIVGTGQSRINFEELVHGPAGEEIWYLTSKVPLRDGDGAIIGLAGWTRDMTVRKQLEREVVASRNQLRYVLTEMSDGIAMFDQDGVLIYCNEQYRLLFPLTSDLRRPGLHLRTILEKVAEVHEQVIPAGHEQEWVEEITASLKKDSEEEVQLFDGRWLHVRTRPTADGSSLVVVSDVTRIKEAETALRSMTEQLKLLATTDGLTGLPNRRAFDAALESEVTRTQRGHTPLGLLIIDVDKFKAFNDLYGHPAGDQVLKRVASCLQDALRRPGDIAARYGGEEFVAILPDTDEDGAFFIADAFRQSLKSLGIPHDGSEKGVVTASVGVAALAGPSAGISAAELLRRADEALYNAKGAGRDRVTGWRPRYEVRPAGAARA